MQPQIIINNANNNTNANVNTNINAGAHGRPVNQAVAFWLCLFLGWLGAHRFYEGRMGTGLLYLFTFGLFGIGWIADTIAILCKPKPYYYV